MSHPKYNYVIDLLNAMEDHFGGVWIQFGCAYKKTNDIIEEIAELLGEYDDLYINTHDQNKGE